MNPSITAWALRWSVPVSALEELNGIFGVQIAHPNPFYPPHTEAWVQATVRLEAARKGLKLWRNNVGVLFNEKGTPVRYGLANDSPRLNETIKSGDLIGWRPIVIQPYHVGTKIAQFISRECKESNWKFSGTDRENAQLKWANVVAMDGGDACFVTGEGTL